MRRAAKIDANQPEIVAYLRERGAMVDIVSMVPGLGYDLIVRFMGATRAVEVKDGTLPPSKRQLTQSEQDAESRWGSGYRVVEWIADCDAMLGEMRGVA